MSGEGTGKKIGDVGEPLDVVYTTPEKVASFLQLPAFTDSTKPSVSEVIMLIKRTEAKIDKFTRQSWRPNSIADELHLLAGAGGGMRVISTKLYRLPIIAISRCEITVGGSWRSLSEGDQGDFWVNKFAGIIFFNSLLFIQGLMTWGLLAQVPRVRVSYTWGHDFATEPRAPLIEDIATKLTAIEIYLSHDYSLVTKSGGDKIPLERKVDIWQEQIDRALEELARLVIA